MNISHTLFQFGSALEMQVVTQITDYTVTNADSVVLVNASAGDIAITLPTGSAGRFYTIKKIDSTGNIVTVAGDGSIDSSITKEITLENSAMEILSDGVDWWII